MNISKLSIIIPAYNEGRTIYPILDRIKDVNLVNGIAKEIIIVNDCSTDDTEKAAKTFMAKIPPSGSFISNTKSTKERAPPSAQV